MSRIVNWYWMMRCHSCGAYLSVDLDLAELHVCRVVIV